MRRRLLVTGLPIVIIIILILIFYSSNEITYEEFTKDILDDGEHIETIEVVIRPDISFEEFKAQITDEDLINKIFYGPDTNMKKKKVRTIPDDNVIENTVVLYTNKRAINFNISKDLIYTNDYVYEFVKDKKSESTSLYEQIKLEKLSWE